MSTTDSPLKVLVRQNIADIASWLLKQEVIAAHELNVELTAETPRVDLVFQLVLDDERTCLFHIEFQGQRSKLPMPRRQLNHMVRLVLQTEWPILLESFVLYTEPYAGSNDSGQHQILRSDGTAALSWNYTSIHLWREPAEPLLALDKRGIIPLMGLMKIHHPETTLPEIVNRLKSEPDEVKRKTLFSTLLALMDDKELLTMLENLIESDEWTPDTPFLRRLRDQAEIATLRGSILEACTIRFEPSVLIYREIEQQLAQVHDLVKLHDTFTAALKANTLDDFRTALAKLLPNEA